MTLNELFTVINDQVGTVNSIVNALLDPYMGNINASYNAANWMYSTHVNVLEGAYAHVDRTQSDIIKSILFTLDDLIYEYGKAITDMRWAMDKSFTDYYSLITWKLEEALRETWNETQRAVTVVDDRIDGLRSSIEEGLDDKITASESLVRGEIDNVSTLLGVDISSLWDGITTSAGEIYNYVAEESAAIYGTISEWVDELWDYVGSFIDWVESQFSAYYTAVRQWILDKATEIYAVIETTVTDLTVVSIKIGRAHV